MLTPEQIKNLKYGDVIDIHATFINVEEDGDIHFKAPAFNIGYYESYSSPDYVSLPTDSQSSTVNSHAPCRPFKKGDRAQVVERNGRIVTCFPVGRIKVGDIVTVAENESGDVFIKVLTEDGHEMMVPWFMLELVKPVEELEKWDVYHDKDGSSFEVKTENHMETAAIIFYGPGIRTEKEAEKAAEAECDRLNAEWRKKVGTEVPCSEDGKEEETRAVFESVK